MIGVNHNLLSSMPLCFNLFGALRNEAGLLPLFCLLFDPETVSITEVICEWAPRPASNYLDDRTAFDAVVFYERSDGPAFCGIETKYTEPFSPKKYKIEDHPLYASVTKNCGWFEEPDRAIRHLMGSASNQLWRNVMLAGALEMTGERGRGSVAVVAVADDRGARRAMDVVATELDAGHADRLRGVSLESIIDAVPDVAPELGWWADRFHRRYLAVDLPDDPKSTADPLGPRFGLPLTRP